jgi:hypothetical protein
MKDKLKALKAEYVEMINILQIEKLNTKLATREYQIVIEQAKLRGKVELLNDLIKSL